MCCFSGRKWYKIPTSFLKFYFETGMHLGYKISNFKFYVVGKKFVLTFTLKVEPRTYFRRLKNFWLSDWVNFKFLTDLLLENDKW